LTCDKEYMRVVKS